MAVLSGCQGKPQLKILDKTCPNCGTEIEMFSIDTEARCEKCGFVIYNDLLTCVQWCKYAKKCVGEETYAQMMRVVPREKALASAKQDTQQTAAIPPVQN